MEELNLLRDRISILIKSYKALRKTYTALEKTCATQEETIAALSTRLKDTQALLLASEAGNIVTDEGEKAQLKKQLDNVIGEIDQILTNLND